MYACLHSLTIPVAALVRVAETFTPRYEVVGPLVMLDVSGVTRLFGTPSELADQMRHAGSGPMRIAIAPTQTTAALLALGRPGVIVVSVDDQLSALGALPVSVLGEFERFRLTCHAPTAPERTQSHPAAPGAPTAPERTQSHPAAPGAPERTQSHPAAPGAPTARERTQSHPDAPERTQSHPAAPTAPERTQPHPAAPRFIPPPVGPMEDVLPYFHHSLQRTTEAAAAPHLVAGAPHLDTNRQPAPTGGGWTHPRDAHAAANTRRPRRVVTAPRELEHTFATTAVVPPARFIGRALRANRAQEIAVESLLDTLRRWGVKTCAQLAALPPGDVYERLGARGILWQRLARGEDASPLVPWVPEDPFEAALDLEWPIEGLEPLSFVLSRLLEPLADRLERADRGAAILHTQLRLVDKAVHARTVQLPAPMRDPKTLRTLILLDLESNPPSAGIDHVRVLIEPTAARVTQWALFERAQPSPEQVSTLLARLTALMGDSHVGSPRLVDCWRPGAFEMTPFAVPTAARPPLSASDNATSPSARGAPERTSVPPAHSEPGTAVRRFRLPIPARVQVQEWRPIRLMTDRRGISGGAVIQSAGPWRTSGEWWNDAAGRSWDRDEWDIAIADGTIYRIYVERDIGQWFIEGVVD